MTRLATHTVGVQPSGHFQLGRGPGRRVAREAPHVFGSVSVSALETRELTLDALGSFVEQDLECTRVRVRGHPRRVLVPAHVRGRAVKGLDAAVAGGRRARAGACGTGIRERERPSDSALARAGSFAAAEHGDHKAGQEQKNSSEQHA